MLYTYPSSLKPDYQDQHVSTGTGTIETLSSAGDTGRWGFFLFEALMSKYVKNIVFNILNSKKTNFPYFVCIG